jgi:hypothetical protein
MTRPTSDDRSDPTNPDSAQRQDKLDKRPEPLDTDDEDSGSGQARDQGDQTEDNKRQQE